MLSSHSSSIISLSSLDTRSSFDEKRISFCKYTNNNKNIFNEQQPIDAKSFDQAINQAVGDFEEILNQCLTPSHTSLVNQQEYKDDTKSKLDMKKRDCIEFLHSLNRKKQKRKSREREQKRNCRRWCEEHNQRLEKIDTTDHSKNRNSFGSTFYCRKALLQKPDGMTYICIRKRFD